MARVSPPNFNKVHFLKLEAAPPDNGDFTIPLEKLIGIIDSN